MGGVSSKSGLGILRSRLSKCHNEKNRSSMAFRFVRFLDMTRASVLLAGVVVFSVVPSLLDRKDDVPITTLSYTAWAQDEASAGDVPDLGWRSDARGCPRGEQLDPYEIWREAGVHSPAEGERFLLLKYREKGLMSFVDWLRCQGFSVRVLTEATVGVPPGQLSVAISFGVASRNRRPLWEIKVPWLRSGTVSGQGFQMRLTLEREVISITYSESLW